MRKNLCSKYNFLLLTIFMASLFTFIFTHDLNSLAIGAQTLAFFVLFPQAYSLYKGHTSENISVHTFQFLMVIHFCYFIFGMCLANPVIFIGSIIFALMTAYILSHIMVKAAHKSLMSYHKATWGIFLICYLCFPDFFKGSLVPNLTAFMAGGLASLCFWPQQKRILTTGDSQGVSIEMYLSEIGLGILWLIWGSLSFFLYEDTRVISQSIFNILTLIAAIAVVIQIIRTHKHKEPSHIKI